MSSRPSPCLPRSVDQTVAAELSVDLLRTHWRPTGSRRALTTLSLSDRHQHMMALITCANTVAMTWLVVFIAASGIYVAVMKPAADWVAGKPQT